MTDAPDRRNFYGRIHGKTLRASQKDYLAEDLGPLTLRGVTRDENPARALLDLGFAEGARCGWRSALAAASIWSTWPPRTPA